MRKTYMNIILFLISGCLGWHPTGHFITARVAEIEILEKKPELHKKLLELLAEIGKYTKENSHPFVESACFPDDIKYLNWKAFNQWHFYDNYIKGEGISKADIDKLPKSYVNIASAISDAKETLKNTKSSKVDDRLGKSFELRYLIHLVGDVHQPLHSASLVDKNNPKGNAGGNAFKLIDPKTDLHTYWDKTLGFFADTTAPLEGKDWEKVDTYSKDLIKRYPRSTFVDEFKKTTTGDWLKESKTIAENVCYVGITDGGKVTPEYREKARVIIEKQLVLGGYRLTNILLSIFDDLSIFTSHKKANANPKDDDEADGNFLAAIVKDRKKGEDSGSDSNDDVTEADFDDLAKKEVGKNKKQLNPKQKDLTASTTDQNPRVRGKKDNQKKNNQYLPLKREKEGLLRKKKAPDNKIFDTNKEHLSEEENNASINEQKYTEKRPEEKNKSESKNNQNFILRFCSSVGSFFRSIFSH